MTNSFSYSWTRLPTRAASDSALDTSLPVASPPACTTRATECAPSLPRTISPSTRSKRGQISMSSRTRSGPSLTSTRTASSSHRPAPAFDRVVEVQVGGI